MTGMKKKTITDKPKTPCERELDDRQRYSLCRLIIDEATDRDYERGTDRKHDGRLVQTLVQCRS